jgi:hypothetical protein
VVIAVLKEALDRPRRVVTNAVPAAVALPRRRHGARDAGARGPDATAVDHAGARPRERARGDLGAHDAAAPAPHPDELVPPEPRGDEEIHVYRSTRRRWRLAIATGLLGFVLAAAVLTVTELAAGGAVGRDSRATTYFGGSERSAPEDDTRTAPGGQDREGEAPATPRDTETSPQDAPQAPQDPAATTPTTPAPAPGEAAPPATPSTPAPETPTPAPAPAPTPAPAPGGEAAPPGSRRPGRAEARRDRVSGGPPG